MEVQEINAFIHSLGVKVPDYQEFLRLSDLTPVEPQDKKFHSVNYERGILLYAMIAKYKPLNVLEIGTAKGFSTLCMAKAMHDYDLSGTIYTIDPTLNIPFTIELDGKSDLVTTPQFWKKIAPKEWLSKIKPLSGYSGEIMSKSNFPKMDFAYIDGHHVYEAVQHDFFSFLNISSNKFSILFDDYALSDGVTKFIDHDVSKNFDGILVKTNTEKHYKELGLALNQKYQVYHAMCFFNSESLKQPLEISYPIKKINDVVQKYQKFEKRWILRQKINQKIPILKNIRFSKFIQK